LFSKVFEEPLDLAIECAFFFDPLSPDTVIYSFDLLLENHHFLIADFSHKVVDEPLRDVGDLRVCVEDAYVLSGVLINVLKVVVAPVHVHSDMSCIRTKQF